ncbi:MAG TPA: 30S ribosomal protein S17 [Candidatus Saccharimonadia bacterium]|nr:30S ribosomal protein S17 [Candidatus Saccharimonadia bacterium]
MAKTLTGFVSSVKNTKTIGVTVVTDKMHPIYKKKYVSSKKYQVHDEKSEAKLGDQVSIIETRPISAKKHFKLDKIVSKAVIDHKEEDPVI